MNKVLITGATGFIGRNCLRFLLNTDFEIHAVSRHDQIEKGVVWHKGDMIETGFSSQLVSSIQPTHLLHMAWNAEPGVFWNTPENLNWLQASIELLQAFTMHGGRRIVMAGTCAEYDWNYGWCSENVTPLNPATLYGTNKNALQDVLASYSKQAGLSSAWGRIFFLYGPNEHPARLISSVTKSLLNNEIAACSHGNQIRDFMHVEDIASAFISLLRSDVEGPVNIASGQGKSIKEIVTKIGVLLDRMELLKFGEIPTSPNDPPLLVADTRRLTDELGWQPSEDLDQRLESTIDWWKSQLKSI